MESGFLKTLRKRRRTMYLSSGEIVLAESCCWERKEERIVDAKCTCGKWLWCDAAGAERCMLNAGCTCGKWLWCDAAGAGGGDLWKVDVCARLLERGNAGWMRDGVMQSGLEGRGR